MDVKFQSLRSELIKFTRLCTHIDVVLLVALVQVVHDGCFVQLRQRGHILHAIDAGLVHSVDPLPGDLGLLQV